MCGIVGYIGERDAAPVLLEGLHRLSYRGYDSAGAAVLGASGRIAVTKTKGRLENLEKRLAEAPLAGTVGIGHTRWATHGEPSDQNAHPHTGDGGRVAVVHNGIIDNHASLRRFLTKAGCSFTSETDSEAAAQLIAYLYAGEAGGDMTRALTRATELLKGSFALCVLCEGEPDTLYCVRKDSPLIVGLGSGEQFVASDIPALLPYTREVILLEDGDIAALRRDGVTVCDAFGRARAFTPFHVDWDIAAAEKGGYPHFMLKEIHEQPTALAGTISPRVRDGLPDAAALPLSEEALRAAPRVTFVACGTAYHAALLGAQMIERLARVPAAARIASEYRTEDPLVLPDEIVIAVTQSGETADTLAALREAKRRGALALTVTNVAGSSAAREAGAERTLYTYAGPEIAVASTKAYTTQCALLLLLAARLGIVRGTLAEPRARALTEALCRLPDAAREALTTERALQRYASREAGARHLFFLGRGADRALAMEAALKIKEISYLFSEAYPAGELKHGPIALITPDAPVIALVTQSALCDRMAAAVQEVKARGARVLAVTTESLRARFAELADETIPLPDLPDEVAPIAAAIPMQLLAYAMAMQRGCDVDQPRNLAKSVTVE